jgi:isopentenyl-diphosphate delta-isomerase
MKDKEEKVILVDEKDNEVGFEDKIKAHQQGKLHRAFSIFLFNKKGELLIQKRARRKYHSGGLWSNTCCSHPRPGEKILEAVKRRLQEEMGIECKLKEVFKLIYKVKVGDLIEHELDHVFVGSFDGKPKPNKNEVEGWRWISLEELERDMKENPKKYTEWLKIILPKLVKKLKHDFE